MQTLTPTQAAKLIGCSAYTIKKLAREKRIPHYRVGNRIMFNQETLANWINRQEKKNFFGD